MVLLILQIYVAVYPLFLLLIYLESRDDSHGVKVTYLWNYYRNPISRFILRVSFITFLPLAVIAIFSAYGWEHLK